MSRARRPVLSAASSVAPEPTELDVIDMSGPRLAEDGDQFVLGTVKAAHATVGLVPDAEVDQLEARRLAAGDEFLDVAPVHADHGHAARRQNLDHSRQAGAEERPELRIAHLARGHRELAVLRRTAAPDMAVHRHVVGRVGEDHGDLLAVEKQVVALRRERIGAKDAVRPEQPEITGARDGRAVEVRRLDGLRLRRGGTPRIFEQDQVNLGGLEAGDRQVQIEAALQHQFGEIRELEPQRLPVPFREFRKAVVGDPQRADLAGREMVDHDDRH